MTDKFFLSGSSWPFLHSLQTLTRLNGTADGSRLELGETVFIPVSGGPWNATMDVTEAADTFSGAGTKTHLATMAVTEATDVWNDVDPVDSVPDDDITVWLGFFGPMAATEAADTFSGAGPGHPPGLFMTADLTEAQDQLDGLGYADRIGDLIVTEAKDVFHGTVQHPKQGTLAVTEAKDIFAGLAFTVGSSGLLATTEPVDRFHGTMFMSTRGTLAATEIADRFTARAPGVVLRIRRLIHVN